jgi:hypothetical protein
MGNIYPAVAIDLKPVFFVDPSPKKNVYFISASNRIIGGRR